MWAYNFLSLLISVWLMWGMIAKCPKFRRPMNTSDFSNVGSRLLWQVSVISLLLGINLSDCERGGTREKVRGMRMESAAERGKVRANSRITL